MAIPCLLNTDCISLAQDGSGRLVATLVLSPDSTNALECRSGSGLYAPSAGELVTTLPAVPFDGEQVFYLADDTNGRVWHLRYRAGSASPYKWEFVGGAELEVKAVTQESRSNAAYGALATPVEITLPANVTGDYSIRHGCVAIPNAGGDAAYQTVKLGASAATDTESVRHADAANNGSGISTQLDALGLASGAVLALQYKTSDAAAANWDRRWMTVRPIRLAAV